MRGGRGPTSRRGGMRFRNALLTCVRRGAVLSGRSPRVAVHGSGDRTRRVVVKAYVAPLNRGGAKAAALHLRYIQRDGVEQDGSKGTLYGPSGPVRAETFEQPRVGENHQFRIIVAPEDGGELDLTAYVRRLMKQVERDLDRSLEWAAVNHHDTGHPHAHVVVRGVDRAGRELRFDRQYIANGLRSRAQELATQELGPRLDIDIRRARANEVLQERFTSLDRELERRARNDQVEVRILQGARIDASTLVSRLQHLEGLRLAERAGPGVWALTAGWQERLRELGTRGDILKQIHRAVSGDPARYHILRSGQPLDVDRARQPTVLVGRVASKGLFDELRGTFYAVLEAPSGAAYHVPLSARAAAQLRAGDIVSFTTRPEPTVRPADRQIAEAASARAGAYVVEPTGSDAPHPLVRRLRELERFGLVTPEGPNRWKVSPNLLRELEERGRAGPARHQVLVRKEALSLGEQVQCQGPVWLDRVTADSLAPYGFGAEVRRALERRVDAVRHLGIQPDDPNRWAKLREVERRAVGRDMAARSGKVFEPDTPNGFRGRISIPAGEATGGSYAVVSDASRFVVVRATDSLRAAEGRTVTLTRDAAGRALVRIGPDRDIGR